MVDTFDNSAVRYLVQFYLMQQGPVVRVTYFSEEERNRGDNKFLVKYMKLAEIDCVTLREKHGSFIVEITPENYENLKLVESVYAL